MQAVVTCHAETKPLCEVLLAENWRPAGLYRFWFISPENSQLRGDWPGCGFFHAAPSSHCGPNSIQRLQLALALCAAAPGACALLEYDCMVWPEWTADVPREGIAHGGAEFANTSADDGDGRRFFAPRYWHFPFLATQGTWRAALDACDGIQEHGFADRWLAAIFKRAGIAVESRCPYSENAIDNHDKEARVRALRESGRLPCAHGVKDIGLARRIGALGVREPTFSTLEP